MNRAEDLTTVNEFMYEGEVFGEATFAAYVELEPDIERCYQRETLLQLKSETNTGR